MQKPLGWWVYLSSIEITWWRGSFVSTSRSVSLHRSSMICAMWYANRSVISFTHRLFRCVLFQWRHTLPFITLACRSIVTKAFCKRIIVDFQLSNLSSQSSEDVEQIDEEDFYLFILIGCHSDELGFFENERFDRRPRNLDQIIRFDDVQARLVAMHRVEYRLRERFTVTSQSSLSFCHCPVS